MLRARCIIGVALFGLLGAAAVVQAAEAEMTAGRYWCFVDNVQVTGDAPEVRLWVALPLNYRGQKVEIGEIYPEPVKILEDPLGGNRIVFWRLQDFEGADEAYVYYDFTFAGELVSGEDIDPEKIEPYDEASPDYQRYMQSEQWIEVTDAIRAKAGEIVGDEVNPYRKAKKIFDWVVYNIRYEYPDAKSRGAAKSFARRSGDCGEFSVVFCALCRAAGVPARTVTAVWLTGGGHQWAEVLLPPYGWVPADTSVAAMFIPGGTIPASEAEIQVFMDTRGIPEADADWLFGNLYPTRLIVSVGNNLLVKYPELGVGKVFRYLQPGIIQAVPPSYEYVDVSDKAACAGFYAFGEGRDDLAAARQRASADLGCAYAIAGEYAKAKEVLIAAVEAYPEAEEAWLYLGQIYLEQGKTDDALNAFYKALDGQAGSAKPVMDAQCHNYLGACYQQKGDLAAARDEFLWVINSGIDYEDSLAFAETHLDEVMLATE
jgi:tetratricopeptide (TPR) repeat protein